MVPMNLWFSVSALTKTLPPSLDLDVDSSSATLFSWLPTNPSAPLDESNAATSSAAPAFISENAGLLSQASLAMSQLARQRGPRQLRHALHSRNRHLCVRYHRVERLYRTTPVD